MIVRIQKLVLGLMMICVGAGCGWNDMEEWSSSAVWSDDAQAVMGVYEYFEGKYSVTHTRKRKIESEVFLMPFGAHNGDPLIRLPRRMGRVSKMYFMRHAGYLIVEREQHLAELDEGMNETAIFHADKISSDGTITSLGSVQALTMMSCDPEGTSATTTGHVLSIFPSPSGTLLAEVRTQTTCSEQEVSIRFLDAITLEAVGTTLSRINPTQGLGLTEYAWLETDRFAFAQPGFYGLMGDSYAPNTDPRPLEDLSYDCFFPPTTSSDTNENGQYISVNEGLVVISQGAISPNKFGCP